MIKLYGAKAFKEELKGAIRDIRPAWVMHELNVPFERISLDPIKDENKSPEYLKLNPTGKVPTLVDGEFSVFESAAICEYLAEKYVGLVPTIGTSDYYKWKQWNYWTATNIEPLCGRIYGADFFMDAGPTTDAIRRMALEALPRFLKPLNVMLSEQKFFMGDKLMVPDVFLTCALNTLRHTEILSDYPSVRAHFDSCVSRPAFQRAAQVNGL